MPPEIDGEVAGAAYAFHLGEAAGGDVYGTLHRFRRRGVLRTVEHTLHAELLNRGIQIAWVHTETPFPFPSTSSSYDYERRMYVRPVGSPAGRLITSALAPVRAFVAHRRRYPEAIRPAAEQLERHRRLAGLPAGRRRKE